MDNQILKFPNWHLEPGQSEAWLWGGADSKDAIKAIETAVDNGMTTIDTAAVYGFGLSEELVGKQ